MARLALLLVALTAACTDSLDELQRDGTGDAIGTAVASAQIYLALSQLGTMPPTLVTGTRDSFAIDGTTASPFSGNVRRTGTGVIDGLASQIHVTADLVAWRDDFWGITLDGQLDVVDTATFSEPTDMFPITEIQQVTGDLELSGDIEGTHSVDLAICRRGDGQLYTVYGFLGTVDGESASDQIQGFDSSCEPRTN